MTRYTRLLLVLTLVALAIAGCSKRESDEDTEFSFVVYPGARYLPQLTDLVKQAGRMIRGNSTEDRPTAIYDTEASLEDVAQYYAKAYGYDTIAPSEGTDLNAAKPPAFRRTGDLQTDAKIAEPLAAKMNVQSDISKAVGTYQAVEIAPKINRPRVTIQRPYFDMTTSQVVDRTIILMSR